MTFTHDFLQRHEITRIDSPNGRKYQTPSGDRFESVTTWLGRSSDKSYLKEWRDRIGDAEADKITKRASERGTRLHNNAEQYLLNERIDVGAMSMLDKSLFVPFSKVLDEHVDNLRAMEYPLYSNTLKLAGTVDLVAWYDGVLSLIDFKTSKNRKSKEDIDDYFIQTLIYSLMVEEMYGIRIKQLVIMIALDYENKVQLFVENRSHYVDKLLERVNAFPPQV